jgi:hypothetical protein
MRRQPFTTATLAVLLIGAIGCTNADEPLIILQNQVPNAGCEIPSSRGTTFLPSGVIDTESAVGYIFNPVVQNNAVDTDNPNLRTVLVEGAEIDLKFQSGAVDTSEADAYAAAGLTNFTKRFSGSIVPDGGTTSFSFEIIPKALLEALADKLGDPSQRLQVTAEVKIFGSMGGGGVESIPFVYPVDVCKGCMEVNVGECVDLNESFTPLEGGECNPLQDVITECCTASDGSEVCPAVPVADPA